MSVPFPSEEWTAELCARLNESHAYASAAKHWEGDVALVIDGQAGVYLDLWHGKCRKSSFTLDPESLSAEFVISGSMAMWTNVLEGQLDPIQGLVQRKLKLRGSLVKIMKHIKAAQELVKCAVAIDTQID